MAEVVEVVVLGWWVVYVADMNDLAIKLEQNTQTAVGLHLMLLRGHVGAELVDRFPARVTARASCGGKVGYPHIPAYP